MPAILQRNKGVLIIEVIIVVAVIGIVLSGLFAAAALSLKLSSSLKKSLAANNLAQESMEALRSFKDGTEWGSGLGALAAGEENPYHLEKTSDNPPSWIIVSGEETTGSFSRKIVIQNVSRSPVNHSIESAYNPANDDPETIRAVVSVSWEGKEIKLISYFTNWND